MSERPSFGHIYMKLAISLSERSTCRRLAVGCVITSIDYRQVYAVGYNGSASGAENDCDRHGEQAVGNCGCFPSGTRVTASSVQRAYRRWYEGPIVRIVTGDKEFSATPNHPILTLGRGWVAADLLTEGDYLFGTRRTECMPSDAPNDHHDVPLEEIFQSIRETGLSDVRYPGAGHHFHGDGLIEQDVDVVSTGCGLTSHSESAALKLVSESTLASSLEMEPLFASDSSLPKRLSSVACAHSSSNRAPTQETCFEKALAHGRAADSKAHRDAVRGLPLGVSGNDLFDGQSNHCISLVLPKTFGNGAQDASLPKMSLDRGVGHLTGSSDPYNSLARLVSPHQIRRIERYRWSGHVYNLQTASGWYSLQPGGIIVKNCIHAEQNAVINCTAARLAPKVVFCTDLPCVICAKFFINLGGVQKVYYDRDYRVRDAIGWLNHAGIEVHKLTVR